MTDLRICDFSFDVTVLPSFSFSVIRFSISLSITFCSFSVKVFLALFLAYYFFKGAHASYKSSAHLVTNIDKALYLIDTDKRIDYELRNKGRKKFVQIKITDGDNIYEY